MGDGYYVPNIQRPGFGYQRRNEDDEDEFNDPLATVSSSGTLSSDTGTQTPDYLPTGMDWMKSYSAPQQPAQADTAPPDIELSPSQPTPPVDPDAAAMQRLKWQDQLDLGPESVPGLPNVGGTPDPESESPPSPAQTGQSAVEQELAASYPPDATQMPVPDTLVPPPFGGGVQPAGPQRRDWAPPPVSAHPEEDRLKAMIQQGPKRSVLGTIAGMAAKFGAGYVNAASRTRNPVPVPTQTARDWALRAPGGGAWDTKLARQTQLAEQEQGEEKRALTAQQMQAQAQERQSNADWRQKHGAYLDAMSANAIQTEQDRRKDREWLSITRLIGKNGEVAPLNPDGSLPSGKGWTKRNDPDHPGKQIAVRPNPGTPIDRDTAELLGIPYSEDGTYVPPSTINAGVRAKISAANAGQASSDKEVERLRREAVDKNTVRHQTEMESIAAGNAADRADAKEQRRTDEINKTLAAAEGQKNRAIVDADRRGDAERNRIRQALGRVKPADEQRIQQQVKADKLIAYNQYATISRQYGGRAWDAKGVDENGDPIQGTEAYGKGETPIPFGGGPTPTTPATPAAPTGGGRGGRGNVPPPVNAAPQAKTMTTADLQDYAKDHTNGNLPAARKIFTDKGWTILP